MRYSAETLENLLPYQLYPSGDMVIRTATVEQDNTEFTELRHTKSPLKYEHLFVRVCNRSECKMTFTIFGMGRGQNGPFEGFG